jgi:alpha-glucosidase (family GH31 glycosyl hydrolase)
MLPEGEWFDYWTGERHAGRQRVTIQVPLERIPLFVKAGTLLPLAEPTLHTADPGAGASPRWLMAAEPPPEPCSKTTAPWTPV